MISPTGPFPRASRIRQSREFRALSRSGRRQSSEGFVVLTAPTHDGLGARLGVTVSRRVGNAVVRNRVKRRIREWFRLDGRAGAAGLDLVVIARLGAGRLGSHETRTQLAALVRSAR